MSRLAFRQAVEAHDWESGIDRLADDVVFRSPVVYKPYEGKDAVAVLLRAVSEVFEDFRYIAQLDSDDGMALVFEARVGDRQLQGLDFLRFDADDRIREFTVMVRPMSGMHALAEAMRAKLEAVEAA
jgi:hypothetical protein